MRSTRPLRVVHVITTFSLGGATETVLLSVRGLRELGYEASIISGPAIESEGGLFNEAAEAGVRVEVIPHLRREIDPIADVRTLAALVRRFRNGQFDIVHTHGSKAGILGRLAARLVGVPVVACTMHAIPLTVDSPLWRRALVIGSERIAARWTDELFSVSRDMVRRGANFRIAPAAQYRIVRSCVDLGRFLNPRPVRQEVRHSWGAGPADVVLGIIGRVYPHYKGQDLLVDLAPRLCTAVPNLRIVVIGTGPMVALLTERVRTQGLADRVRFVGSYPPDDMPEVISALDVLILASTHEGLPRVFVQALACRKPVISYDRDGAPEVIADRVNGRLVAPGDVEGLVEAITELAKDDILRRQWGAHGPAAVDPEFRVETMIRATDESYRSLLARAGLPLPPARSVPPFDQWRKASQPSGGS